MPTITYFGKEYSISEDAIAVMTDESGLVYQILAFPNCFTRDQSGRWEPIKSKIGFDDTKTVSNDWLNSLRLVRDLQVSQ